MFLYLNPKYNMFLYSGKQFKLRLNMVNTCK